MASTDTWIMPSETDGGEEDSPLYGKTDVPMALENEQPLQDIVRLKLTQGHYLPEGEPRVQFSETRRRFESNVGTIVFISADTQTCYILPDDRRGLTERPMFLIRERNPKLQFVFSGGPTATTKTQQGILRLLRDLFGWKR